VQDVTFGLHFTAPPWQNPQEPADVNRDGLVSLADLLLVVQHLRSHGFGDLVGEPEGNEPRIDVNGDNLSTLQDLIEVVDVLRDQMNGGGEGESLAAGGLQTLSAHADLAPAPEGETNAFSGASPQAVADVPVVIATAPTPSKSADAENDEQLPVGLSLTPEHGPHECGDEHEHPATGAASHLSIEAYKSQPSEYSLEEALDAIAAAVALQRRDS
jgi:hypothetical protein